GFLEVNQVVVDHAHAKPAGADVANAPADPAHAEDTKGQLVELPPTNRIADAFDLLGLVDGVAEEVPRPQHLQHVAEDEVADGQGVGVRRINDLHATPAASRRMSVL